ncbi:O-antigen ligase family protein [Patescibacteria group bacterium]|nr:O-antigen ligase family protein [Patescibacteria group bacterium]MBU1256487.1 O-antigen ligase family protein [Patescibacteria group bacterium]MBU1457287.1 O-antigen ligase family protein [Patescibacteria group bacterium]
MAFLTQLILLLWPLYQLSQLPFARLYLVDLVVLLCVILQARKLKFNHPLLKPVLFFLFVATLSLLFVIPAQAGIYTTAILYLARLFLYSSLLLISLPKETSSLINISFFMIPVLGLLQYFFFPDLRFLKTIGYDDHYFRLTFPFLDPNFTGAVLAFISLYSIKIIKTTKGKTLFGLSLVALTLTFSRISWLGFAIGLLYLFIKNQKLRLPVILTLTGLVFLITISPKPFGEGVNLARTYSITSRLSNYKHGWDIFKQNPIIGVGYNTLPFSMLQRSSAGLDNSFIFVLATTGVIGLTSFIYLLIKTWILIPNTYLKSAFLSLLIHSLANNTLFYAPITILVFLLLNLNARKTPL